MCPIEMNKDIISVERGKEIEECKLLKLSRYSIPFYIRVMLCFSSSNSPYETTLTQRSNCILPRSLSRCSFKTWMIHLSTRYSFQANNSDVMSIVAQQSKADITVAERRAHPRLDLIEHCACNQPSPLETHTHPIRYLRQAITYLFCSSYSVVQCVSLLSLHVHIFNIMNC
jgi:hypothetical protein